MQGTGDQIPDFIQKLLRMMRDHKDLIKWGNNGEELVITNQKQFEQLVLHKFFRHGKLESFVRQLNMYNFHKVCRNKNSINFRNKFFFEGNQSNFHLIKRRKKDGQEQQQPVDKVQEDFLKLINQKHGEDFPELPTIVQQILQFKARSNKTMNKLRKSLDILGRQLNQRKGKIVKPTITQIKQMISSIDDSSKKTQMSIEQLVQNFDKDTCSVKKQEQQNEITEKIEQPRQQFQMHQMPMNIPHQMPSNLSYPALHSQSGFFGTVYHSGNGILTVSPLCSFNSVHSVTNFIS